MTPLPSSTPLSRSAARVGTAFLFLMALAGLAACGGGGGSGQATVPPVDTSLVVSPATVEANANTPLRIEGGMFIPPVRVLLVNAAGAPVGPLMDGVVRDQGRRVDVDSPVLAHLDEDADCFVQVRDGAGRVARSERPLHIRSRGNAVAAIDGSDHTPGQPTWGQAGIHLRLDVPSAHGDGISTPGRGLAAVGACREQRRLRPGRRRAFGCRHGPLLALGPVPRSRHRPDPGGRTPRGLPHRRPGRRCPLRSLRHRDAGDPPGSVPVGSRHGHGCGQSPSERQRHHIVDRRLQRLRV